jgi:Spy/CpxP family protein refolding chaperone
LSAFNQPEEGKKDPFPGVNKIGCNPKGRDHFMNQNSENINKRLNMNRLSILFIMFLMAALIFFLFLLMSAGKALADPWGRGMRQGLGQRSYVNADLTPEQSAKMEKIQRDHWKEIAPFRQELGAKRAEMRLLDSRSKTEATRLDSLRKDIHDLQEKIREKNLSYQFQCQNLLTPEQRDSTSSFGPGRGRGSGKGWGDR